MKIGLFFGSFNPIHIGHLIIANFMAENSDLDKVWFIVTPQNPFKKDTQNLLHDFDRLDMVRAACFENENFDVKDIEFHLPKPNYTANTLIQLQEKYPENKLSPTSKLLVNTFSWSDSFRILHPKAVQFSRYQSSNSKGATRIYRAYQWGELKVSEAAYH